MRLFVIRIWCGWPSFSRGSWQAGYRICLRSSCTHCRRSVRTHSTNGMTLAQDLHNTFNTVIRLCPLLELHHSPLLVEESLASAESVG